MRAEPVAASDLSRIAPGVWRGSLWLSSLCLLASCEPEFVVGNWTCGAPDDPSLIVPMTAPLETPWETSFERGFCDYVRAPGFCYSDGDAAFDIVDAPVLRGKHAAAFSVSANGNMNQARCVREGELPRDAIYGAWFFIPAVAENTGNWNLIHFRGREPGSLHGVWDVSLGNTPDGNLAAYVRNQLEEANHFPTDETTVPIGEWFHLEFRWLRSELPDGEVMLYQDGKLLVELTNIQTDDSELAQWYVGNLADGLDPSDSVVYVDDVTIRSAP